MQKTALVKALGLTFGAVLMTACASKGDVTEGDATQPLATADQAAEEVQTKGVEAQAVAGEQVDAAAAEAAAAANAALLDVTTFYFGFDQSTIKADSKNALIAHAQYLDGNPSARVVLEGHADERGTVEYNLALGERRALSVSRFLQANGADANQIQTVSFGEERPAKMGHNEDSWAENRRVEIKYQSR